MAAANGRTGATPDAGRRPFGGRSISALLSEIARAPEVDIGKAAARLRPGVIVEGRFEIVREVGRGGFGVVYEARDLSLGRTVAFKVVGGGGQGPVREDRLVREAAAAARLSHPNIVQLHDLGHSEYGPYLVLELLHGRTLAEILEDGPLPAKDALHVARDVAAALAHAHSAGVFHRDLNPGNVFLDEDGHFKVLDLGLAHAFGQREWWRHARVHGAGAVARGAGGRADRRLRAGGARLRDAHRGAAVPRRDRRADAAAHPTWRSPGPSSSARWCSGCWRDPVARPRDAAAVARELDEMNGQAPEAAPSPHPGSAPEPVEGRS